MKRKSVVGVALATSTAIVLAACANGDIEDTVGFEDCDDSPTTCNSGERSKGGDITWALDNAWQGWNVVRAENLNVQKYQALAGLSTETGFWQPDGTWDYNDALWANEPTMISQSPMQVEYELNEDANWGDGNPVTLDDFIYSWYQLSGDSEKCLDCSVASRAYGGNVARIDETDEGTIVVTYEEGHLDPEWLYHTVVTHPAHIVEAAGFTDWRHDAEVMAASSEYLDDTVPTWSAGPFRISDGVAGDYVIYEPNPDYAGSAEVSLDSITLQVIEPSEIITEIRQGSVDGAAPASVSAEMISQLARADGIRYRIHEGPSWTHIDFNTNSVDDLELRRAIFTMIDVDTLNDSTVGLVQPSVERKTNHIFRNSDDHHVDHLTLTGQGSGDVTMAHELLVDAGYTHSSSGELLDAEGNQVSLTMRANADDADMQAVSEMVQQQLGEMGVEVILESISAGQLTTVLSEQNYDLVAFTWSGTPTFTGAPSQYWSSDSASNFGKLDDPELDELVEAIKQTTDMDEAAKRTNAAVEAAIAQAYSLPLADTQVVIMVSDRMVNVRDNWASNMRALYNMAEWGVIDA
ncbi:ABC transporter substrate-binding protein [Natronoglycomyces albus]|uniref:Solute-binding protein family 5 domain-containing protein n=1 Tax=Natronoglycomyces albus TaxID=2811108 RepID=A0A895XST6_9ACTN|nr:ABC transporter substrate-binding protein [Natronoglycomyces albus]QSB04698.1 hypothetical protein JQS30_13100 [Natronoglycomyces albus]